MVMASRSKPVPSCLACAAGTAEVKKTHTCAPAPERDTSSAAVTPYARAAFTYARAPSREVAPSKSAASQWHRSLSSSGYRPISTSPDRCRVTTSSVSGR